jgi:transposase InsO family protein
LRSPRSPHRTLRTGRFLRFAVNQTYLVRLLVTLHSKRLHLLFGEPQPAVGLLESGGALVGMVAEADVSAHGEAEDLRKRRSFRSRDQAWLALFRYIEAFYNPLRRHSSLEMLSPDEHGRRYWENNAAAAAA